MSLEVAPLGAEFMVAEAVAADQMYPVMTRLSDGRVEALWYDDALWSQGIVRLSGRFLDSAGVPTGGDFTVDSSTASGSYYIYNYAAAALGGGSSVVAWADPDVGGIGARILDAGGNPVGNYIQISSQNLGSQETPSVVALDGGAFMVTWTDRGVSDVPEVKARIFTAAGQPLTDEFAVNDNTAGGQVQPQASALPGGGFVISWWDGSGVGGDPDSAIKARVFNAAGDPAGPEFLANTDVVGTQASPVITTLADGRFVIAWINIGAYPDFGVRAQIFSPAGEKLGAEFWVDGPGGGARGDQFVRIAALDGGGFVVTWDGDVVQHGMQTIGQVYDAAGAAIGDHFIANTDFVGSPFYSAVSALPGNRFVVSWTEAGSPSYDVKAQVFTVAESHVGTVLADRLTATTTQDYIAHGQAGNDTLTGNAGRDVLYGEDGNDRLDGRAGADMLVGGAGNDTYFVDNAGDVVVEQVGAGTDLVNASISYTLAANVEKLTLTGAANLGGTGNDLANTLTGNAGNNQLAGGLGKDVLSGGAGNDLLIGGSGADILTGGTGADTFRFNVLETATSKDTIKDFSHADDTIEISRAAFAAFAALPAGVLDPLQIAFGAAATTASQHLVYNVANGALYYDADGMGGAAQVQIAVLTNKAVLDASDFVLI